MRTLLIVLILLILLGGGIGTLPHWGYHNYGYYPSGGFGTIIIVLVILALLGVI